jgi:hypothetical protein
MTSARSFNHPLTRIFLVGPSGEPSSEALFESLGNHCEIVRLMPALSFAGWLPLMGLFRRRRCLLPHGAFSSRRWLVRLLAPLVERRLLSTYGTADALIITDPYFWPYAIHFRSLASKIAYYVCDDYAEYPYVRLDQEKLVAQHADLLFTVSRRLAEVLCRRYGLKGSSFHIIPNGIPASWLPAELPPHPAPLPKGFPVDFRPLIGIIGVIGTRIDLLPIVAAHDALPELHWLFVGPVRRQLPGLAYLQGSPRCHFLGAKPYEELQPFFAALDAAVLPLTDDDINPCSSPVRFFSQLPTGQPIVYTAPAPRSPKPRNWLITAVTGRPSPPPWRAWPLPTSGTAGPRNAIDSPWNALGISGPLLWPRPCRGCWRLERTMRWLTSLPSHPTWILGLTSLNVRTLDHLR